MGRNSNREKILAALPILFSPLVKTEARPGRRACRPDEMRNSGRVMVDISHMQLKGKDYQRLIIY